MTAPAVSILLPAYNAEKYLRETIDSLLQQTFTDFELLIINDGSTDNTEKIINSYTDGRIQYVKNEKNSGLIYTLNKGIDLAKGEYIARMDADDICLPQRLEKQKDWLDSHPATDIAGCYVELIDEHNNSKGTSPLDTKTTTYSSIRKKISRDNCMSHPTVMMRSEIAKRYKYSIYQHNVEDYDLWLRLCRDNRVIEKVPEVLLLYRIHAASIVSTHQRKKNFFFIHFKMKMKFLQHGLQNGRFTGFDLRVMFEAIFDLVKSVLKEVKKKLK